MDFSTRDEQLVVFDPPLFKKFAEMSEMVKDVSASFLDTKVTVFPLANVDHKTLNFIIEFLKLAMTHDEAKSVTPTDHKTLWEKKTTCFMEPFVTRVDDLCALDLAANYLAMAELIRLCSKTLAAMIHGKSTEEMREILHITNDFAPDDEASVRRVHAWAGGR